LLSQTEELLFIWVVHGKSPAVDNPLVKKKAGVIYNPRLLYHKKAAGKEFTHGCQILSIFSLYCPGG
jgi:hypothetical protein